MDEKSRGYVLIWRKIWDHPICSRPHEFSEAEAWIYLISNLANGVERNGLPRGQFEASRKFLAKRWLWEESRVHRFLCKLQSENMIQKVNTLPNTLPNTQANRFIICNYETYQNPRTGNRTPYRTGNRTQSKEGLKEGLNSQSDSSTKNLPDLAYETFAEEHLKRLGSPYQSTTGDFVRLAALRRQLSIPAKTAPEDWAKTVGHYLDSPMGKYSLADLASRYAVFRQGPLDRYGKPCHTRQRSIHEELFGHPYPDKDIPI